MSGGTGNDTFIVDSISDVVTEYALGGYDIVNASVSFSLAANVENLTLTGTAYSGSGNSLGNIISGNASNNYLYGDAGSDSLYGNDGNDIVSGGDGFDYVAGGNGNDSLYGGGDTDTLTGGTGNDSLYGGDGNDSLYGGTGNDFLYGGNGNDFLYGDAGSDNLFGDAGSDYVKGYGNTSGEYDNLTGGAGADRFVIGAYSSTYYLGSGYATIKDFKYAEGDRVQVAGSTSSYTLNKTSNFGGTSALDTAIYKVAI